jgi:predicted Zn-dependent peptidase
LDDKGLTVQTALSYDGSENPGLVYVIAIANMGKELPEIEDALNTEIENVKKELVSEEEFQMAMAAKEFQAASGLQSLEGVAGALAGNYTYFKDANRINKELDYYGEITREDLLNVARKYFQPESRVVLYYLSK